MLPWLLLATLSNTPMPTPTSPFALRVLFAHQSVGDDLLAGVRRLAPEIRIERSVDGGPAPGIWDVLVGRNEDPLGKLEHFERLVTARAAELDVAMVKLCYVDITSDTDVEALGARYRAMVERLAAAAPNVRLVHVTTPLTTVQSGPKAWLKRALGKAVWGERDNPKRDAYNRWLRETYPRESIFDLGDLEARAPDGTRASYELDGRVLPMLWNGYSRDGGHLNERGQAMVAEAFLNFLSSLGASR